ncbi:MAG: sigma-70 family RNA polymerase sigma factor [Chloroflexota bacterium]|nr:sigma-70 family RNA polymerase sigma factor [Chloroflexota bacterium]
MMSPPPPREIWEHLYRQAYPTVYRALAATLLDADRAADALQEAFIAGLRRPPRHDRNLPGWLYQVALRKARRDLLRSVRIVFRDLVSAHAQRIANDELDRVLDRISVGELLRLLTERQRSIVVAYYFLDLSQDEIAELLGIKRGTVAATIAQALARMRQGGIHVL